jgi:hypothetical protein
MVRAAQRAWGIVCVAGGSLLVYCTASSAISLDKEGDIKLGVRTYVNVRIGTEATDSTENLVSKSDTFPFSGAAHLRQNRAFIEAELDHDLSRLVKERVGPLALINYLPFRIKGFKYHLTYRGEYDGVYDWGPREYSTAAQYYDLPGNPIPAPHPPCQASPVNSPEQCNLQVDVYGARHGLRQTASVRNTLFQAYVEGEVGGLFIRFGRQLLVWGETDGFRLLDNINPLDNSFGGFLISLDERRVPLDMLRLQYYTGNLGPLTDSFIEMYGAIDDKVGFSPGIPQGSPWALPNLGAPTATLLTFIETPSRTFNDIRGGGRFVWNMFDATFSLAHYYTYVDTPAVQFFVEPKFPLVTFPNGFSAQAFQTAPLVQISGATTTFALPSLYAVVRSELAYFKGEPRFRQSQLDPFVYHYYDDNLMRIPATPPQLREARVTGGRSVGDSINYVLGFDKNQWIRMLNSNQTFFFSTQLFYKHLKGAVKRQPIPGRPVEQGEVLPVPERYWEPPGVRGLGKVEPQYVRQATDQFLQTFFVGTSYRSGTINPGFTFFYDWSGAVLYQPSISFSRDPFRFVIDCSIIDAHELKGNSGVSLYRDRDNVQFRFEYVI